MVAGAMGYIVKGATREQTLRQIRAVADGEMTISQPIARKMKQYFRNIRQTSSAVVFPDLTPREREILDLMIEGLTNADIAERLTISYATVRNHNTSILSKLHVTDRTQAVIKAIESNFRR
jgi:DNA-binding NarL/FixJ family response regulator